MMHARLPMIPFHSRTGLHQFSRRRRTASLVVLAVLAWICWTTLYAHAQQGRLQVIEIDPLLRHIGDGRYGNQCGKGQLDRLGLWGDLYAIEFVTDRQRSLRVRLERVWGVAPGQQDRVLVNGREIGRLPPSQDFNDPGCAAAWTSAPFDVEPGRHVLTVVSGRLREGIDDLAFQGMSLLVEQRAAILWYGKGRVSYEATGTPRPRGWLEVFMDTTTLVATFGLLAFMVERLTNGLAVVLGYWGWWRVRMEVSPTLGPDTRARIERNRRVGLFALTALLAVVGALLMQLNLLASLGLGAKESIAGQVVTGLMIASGADPIREFLKLRETGRAEPPPSPPIQLTGTVILQQAPPGSPGASGAQR
jgi:hypothetical protein